MENGGERMLENSSDQYLEIRKELRNQISDGARCEFLLELLLETSMTLNNLANWIQTQFAAADNGFKMAAGAVQNLNSRVETLENGKSVNRSETSQVGEGESTATE